MQTLTALCSLAATCLASSIACCNRAARSRKLFQAENSAIADAEPSAALLLSIGDGLRIICLVLLLRGLVPVELALNPAEAVGPGADQVSLDVIQFILIGFQFCLGQIDPLLQSISCASIFLARDLLL